MTERDFSNRIINKLIALVEQGRVIERVRPSRDSYAKRREVKIKMADGKDERVFVDIEDDTAFDELWMQVIKFVGSLPDIQFEEAGKD
jgi:hypothetical protein